MRAYGRALAALATAVLAACAPVPRSFDDVETRFKQVLKERPDDPDVLFIHHSSRDLSLCSKLARLRREPVVMAAVVAAYVSGSDEDDPAEFDHLVAEWRACDPDNAMPVVLIGMRQIANGKLEKGVDTIVAASRMRVLRTYSLEILQETWRL